MNPEEIDISSSSSNSSSPCSSPTRNNICSLEEDLDLLEISAPIHQQLIKTEGEVSFDELPPVEPVDLVAPLEKIDQIGRVFKIIGKLVIVVSFKDSKPLDLDSALFLRDCSPLGRIFDTFGPVTTPYYAVRFNTVEEIEARGVRINAPVYFVPDWPEPLTKYVFYQDLKKIKGSDASWKNDNEIPEDLVDYSDDEEERLANRKRKIG